MGCDIHCYVEYKDRSGSTHWNSFGERINPGRDYQLFALLAGVRGEGEPLYPVRGVPAGLGYYASIDYWLYISDDYPDSEGCCSTETAHAYAIDGSHYSEDKSRISNPDWHSHSWLTTAEYNNCLDACDQLPYHYSLVEYRALLAAMRSLENTHDVRMVFWFDN
jgi:hypothetical protein